MAKFESTKKSISNYDIRTYDRGLALAEGIHMWKLPMPIAPTPPKKTKKSTPKIASSELSATELGDLTKGEVGERDNESVGYKLNIRIHYWKDRQKKY